MDLIGRRIDYRYVDKIPETRKLFSSKLKLEVNENEVYPEDVTKTLTNDSWVEKFLEWHGGDTKKTVDGLLFSLKTQKKYRIRELKDTDYPAEFYSRGSMFIYEPDRLGRPTLYIRMMYSPSCPDTRDMTMQYLLYNTLKYEGGENGYNIVFEYSGFGIMSNFDAKLAYMIMDVGYVFPNSAHLVIHVNIPKPLRILVSSSIKMLLTKRQAKGYLFLSSEELRDHVVPVEALPDFLGGTCKTPYKGMEMVPAGCLPMKEMINNFMQQVLETSGNNNSNNLDLKKHQQSMPIMLPEDMDQAKATRVIQYFDKLMSK